MEFLVLLTLVAMFFSGSSANSPNCKIFAFGDSKSDVGGFCKAYGYITPTPPGQRPSCRSSDGLLYIDFLCAGLGMNTFLSPYLGSVGSDFSNGVDFAVGSVTAEPNPLALPGQIQQFPLPVQINQFARFQHRVKELRKEGKCKGPQISDKDFINSIFTIDVGQNYLSYPLFAVYNRTYLIESAIPNALESIENATKDLYTFGARKLVLYNTGPIGCLPGFLDHIRSRGLHVDEVGCVEEYNELAKLFNDGLASIATRLRGDLMDTTLVYTDMYSIKYDLIANASKYGLENPLGACKSNGRVCIDPSRAVSWDGIHYSQAANKIVASRIMAGYDSYPFTPFKELCDQKPVDNE